MLKKLKRHSFSDEVCQYYGFTSAVLLDTFAYWTALSEVKKQLSKQGHPYFSCTFDGLLAEFPFFRGEDIATALESLKNAGILFEYGNANPNNLRSYFRVNWDVLESMGLEGIRQYAFEDANTEAGFCRESSDDIDKIYNAYPTYCPLTNRPTKKRDGTDKACVTRILKEGFSVEAILSAIADFAKSCEDNHTYLPNYTKFASDHIERYLYAHKEKAAEPSVETPAFRIQAPVTQSYIDEANKAVVILVKSKKQFRNGLMDTMSGEVECNLGQFWETYGIDKIEYVNRVAKDRTGWDDYFVDVNGNEVTNETLANMPD